MMIPGATRPLTGFAVSAEQIAPPMRRLCFAQPILGATREQTGIDFPENRENNREFFYFLARYFKSVFEPFTMPVVILYYHETRILSIGFK